jgi:hypothetical protein
MRSLLKRSDFQASSRSGRRCDRAHAVCHDRRSSYRDSYREALRAIAIIASVYIEGGFLVEAMRALRPRAAVPAQGAEPAATPEQPKRRQYMGFGDEQVLESLQGVLKPDRVD